MTPLLPSGFYDELSPEAEGAAAAAQALLGHFADHGYRRVAPPLLEFEETLLAGPGAALNRSTFRVMDPASQRMLGLRTDHTLQVARIAATRLEGQARPLRLSYAGPVLRLTGSESDPQRQATQVGVELIGSLAPEADAEVIALALGALDALGITDASVDVLLPTLIPGLCEAYKLEEDARAELHRALDRKDEAAVAALAAGKGGKAAELAGRLLRASGEATSALQALEKMDLPESVKAERLRLAAVLNRLAAQTRAAVTVDLVEFRGFQYQTGLSFSVFSRTAKQELGRGGRYRTPTNEAATGFTFYAERLMAALPPAAPRKRLLAPADISAAEAKKWIGEGYALVRGFAAMDAVEAAAQGCAAYVKDGEKNRALTLRGARKKAKAH